MIRTSNLKRTLNLPEEWKQLPVEKKRKYENDSRNVSNSESLGQRVENWGWQCALVLVQIWEVGELVDLLSLRY